MGSTSQNAGGPDPASLSGYRHDEAVPIQPGWLVAFVVAALVGQVAAGLSGTQSTATYLASCAVLAVVVVLALVLPRLDVSSWVQLLALGGYVVALAWIVQVAGGRRHRPATAHPAPHRLGRPLPPAARVARSPGRRHRHARGDIAWAGGRGRHRPTRRTVGDHRHDHHPSAPTTYGAGSGPRSPSARRHCARRRCSPTWRASSNSTLDPGLVVTTGVRVAAEIASPPGRRARRANYCRIADGIVTVEAEFDTEGGWTGATWPSLTPTNTRCSRGQRPNASRPRVCSIPPSSGRQSAKLAREQGVGHGAWVPVVVDGELHGALAVAGRNRPITEHELARCVAIVRIMELALANALAHEQLRRAAHTDPLTSLANRRVLEELVRARRGRRPFTRRQSMSTGSSTSTIATATPPETSCCSPSRTRSAPCCAPATSSPGSAAMSLPRSCSTRMRGAVRRSPPASWRRRAMKDRGAADRASASGSPP